MPRPEPAELDPDAEAVRKAANKQRFAERNARAAAANVEPLSDAQRRYLSSLATKVSRERFDEELAAAIKGTGVPARAQGEKTQEIVARLTNSVARKMISALSGRR